MLYAVQAKWHNDGKGSIDVGSILKFLKGVKNILNGHFHLFNDKVKKKQKILSSAIEDANTRIVLITVHSGKDRLSHEVSKEIQDFLDDQNGFSEILSHKGLNLQQLHSSLVDINRGESIQEEIALFGWGDMKQPYHAIYGRIAVSDTANWYKKYGSRLFAKKLF